MGARELAVILSVKGCLCMDAVEGQCHQYLGGRTGKSCKDTEICCGYKAVGTAGVKEIAQLKRFWSGWLHQVGRSALAYVFFVGRLKIKPGPPCILKLSNLP